MDAKNTILELGNRIEARYSGYGDLVEVKTSRIGKQG